MNMGLSVQVVDKDAFRGVSGYLTIKSSHLTDDHLPALLPLTQLRRLNIALNKKFTDIDRLLNALPSLDTLDASGDGITALGGRLQPVSSRLRVLNVTDNPLVDVAADAFVGLPRLEVLRLDGARLALSNDSFAVQRTTLRKLTLKKCDFTRSPWRSIAGLSALQTLDMSEVGCGVACTLCSF